MGNEKVDNIDRYILAELIDNSRASYKKLASNTKLHPNTILQRIKKLEKMGLITRYTTIVDFEKIGYGFQAMIFIKVNMNRSWKESLRPLSKLPQMVRFLILTGEYDAAAIVRVKDMAELYQVLEKIQENPAVGKTTTNIISDYYKHSYDFNPLRKISIS